MHCHRIAHMPVMLKKRETIPMRIISYFASIILMAVFSPALSCVADERSSVGQTVHELRTIREIKDGDVFFLRANMRAGEHGVYVIDGGCGGYCQDILAIDIPIEIQNRADIYRLIVSLDETRVENARPLEVYAKVSINFVQIPGSGSGHFYRISSLNILEVLHQEWGSVAPSKAPNH